MRPPVDLLGCFPTGRHYAGIAHLLRVVVSGQAEEFAGDRALAELDVVSIDTETTGRDPTQDRVVEIACVTLRGGVIVRKRSWLVDPERPIPEEARAVHGILDEHVQGKPKFAEIVEELLDELEGAVPLAYNAEYDSVILHTELARAANASGRRPPAARKAIEWIDPLVWARELHRAEKSKSLGEVCARLEIPLAEAHRAEHDAEAALRILLEFQKDARVPKTYGAFVQEQRRLARLHADERRLWRNTPARAVS